MVSLYQKLLLNYWTDFARPTEQRQTRKGNQFPCNINPLFVCFVWFSDSSYSKYDSNDSYLSEDDDENEVESEVSENNEK